MVVRVVIVGEEGGIVLFFWCVGSSLKSPFNKKKQPKQIN